MSRPHCSECPKPTDEEFEVSKPWDRETCTTCPTLTNHRSGKCKPCRNNPKGSPMTKIVLLALIALNLSACGKTNYEYFTGERGPAGSDGIDGQDGAQGTPGIDATSVTVVKLCPGVTVYPSKFVEIAFCLGGKLYGTYSANGGFSTELPPGTYLSNGINASCNVTIGANCTVSN